MKTILHEVGRDANFKIWHALSVEENMIIYFHSGEGSIVSGDSVYPIKPGALCFIGAGKYHYTVPSDPKKYDRSKLFFPTSYLRGIVSLIGDGRSFSRFAYDSIVYAELPEREREYASAVINEAMGERSAALDLSIITRLLHLMELYSTDSASAASGAIGGAIDYINKNIFRDVTIDEVCGAVHISKYYFCRRFKADMGITVMDYILKTRVMLARQMLERENVSITEVSDRCGFSSVSYFCRVFKESVGVTPLKYKKSIS